MWDNELYLKSKTAIYGMATEDILIAVIGRRRDSGVIISEMILGPLNVEVPGAMTVIHSWCVAS